MAALNLRAYRPSAPAPLTPDETRRGKLYALVKQLDEEAARHRRRGEYMEADDCAQRADDAQREISGLYIL